MKNIYVKDIITKCSGKLIVGNENDVLENFSKDTRTINKCDIYVGIKGESFEGSNLYKDAINKGAKGCILNDTVCLDYDYLKEHKDVFIVLVKDTIKCLQQLATYKRSLYDIPVIAITGSVGKTSTKDIIASVLNKKYNVLKTEGNYNNHIGVPLTILRLKDHDCLVVEMGMNNLGEISVLSKIAKPTVAVITNVGTAHIGILKSRENILKAKLEILDGLTEDGILVINNDNDLLSDWHKNNNQYKVTSFGTNDNSDVIAKNIYLDSSYSTYDCIKENEINNFKINIPGIHFVLNGLCAYTIGNIFDISNDEIKNGIENFELSKRRMEIEKINGVTVINDCYNANLDSMKSAIGYLGSLNNTRKIAVLGSMLELGDYEEMLHRKVGIELFDNKIDLVLLVGNATKYTLEELLKLGYTKNNAIMFDNNQDVIKYLKQILKENDSVLIKASNGMKFIEIYESLKK